MTGVPSTEFVNELDEADERGIIVDKTLSHLECQVCGGTNDAELWGLGDYGGEAGTRNDDERSCGEVLLTYSVAVASTM